jgi:hypothetical protein
MINRIKELAGFKAEWMIFFSMLLCVTSSVYSQSLLTNTSEPKPDPDSCQHWFGWHAINPTFPTEFKMQYDTLKHYIESCAKDDNESWRAFLALASNLQEYDQTDTNRYRRHRDWLISVLYLNSTNMYYCTCLESIAGTYKYDHIPNAWLGVIKFMLTTSSCYSASLATEYTATINNRHNLWLQGDTTIPEDTTIPSLHELGLDFLLTHNSVSPSVAVLQDFLTSFTLSLNPFKNETHLRFHLNRMAYTSIGIYDVLGYQVWGEGKGRSLEAGDHEVVVDGRLLPEGLLYARIETGFWEVRTVKLVKE